MANRQMEEEREEEEEADCQGFQICIKDLCKFTRQGVHEWEKYEQHTYSGTFKSAAYVDPEWTTFNANHKCSFTQDIWQVCGTVGRFSRTACNHAYPQKAIGFLEGRRMKSKCGTERPNAGL